MAARTRGRVESTRPFSPRGKGSALWRNLRAIALPVALFLVIRTFFMEAYRIPSGSMIPAMLVGDWLFVNKLVYGPHIPFTDAHLPGYAEPQRGEIVVFRSPPQLDQPHDPTPTLVKRVVGTPNDTLYMRGGVLYLNGIPQRQGDGAVPPGQDSPSELFTWQEAVAIRGSRFGAPPEQITHDEWGPLVVTPGHYFMMGDNRYNSKDSRYWGLVPRENVRGRPMFVYYSYNADDSDRPLPFITDIRWGRIGHWIR
ncbi:signal peptidase I [soil metagenome]